MTTVELETEHGDARAVARAVAPDNTDEMETVVEDGNVVTRIERDDVASAGATADDYLRNLIVADELSDAL
ncbi:KEOPS complex subunit Pcc1 [Haladaptatus sp. F3-133]|uniref:KEOPS complex subunit Pcc1 n=1 Tax=Halorutilus salinus TaxID=2487751 RepID=A0A9Q4GH98_9EURY|nr:KEOPS complex subunit Pcc1 [Halorutilus salinus]MCX2819949.1 KEOPS complex subunit Pcc1 [Halorutilus salinus]